MAKEAPDIEAPKINDPAPKKARPRAKPKETAAEAKERTRRQNKNALLIAIIAGLAALGSAAVTGFFQLKNVNDKLASLHPVKLLGGDWSAGEDNPKWELGFSAENGAPKDGSPEKQRSHRIPIVFEEPFKFDHPTVLITVTTLDEWGGGGLKWVVAPDNISKNGFDIKIRALAHTAIFSIGGEWIAYQR